jgi:hypothetical protein
LKNDKEVVMAAVQQNGLVLQFVGALRKDPEVACEAVKRHPNALRYVDPSLDDNDKFIQCMIVNRIPPRVRPKLKEHMMTRHHFKMAASNTLPPDMINAVTEFAGGKRRRKRTRRRLKI